MTGVRRHPRLRRDASVALLVLGVLAISVPPPAGGQTIVLQNDSVVDFGQVAVLPGFAADERAAAWLTSPCAGELTHVRILWLSVPGNQPDVLHQAVDVYEAGTFPTPGTRLRELLGPVMQDGGFNEFVVAPAVPIAQDQTVVVDLQLLTAPPPLGPSLVTDIDGCQAQRNAVFAIPGGWTDLCSFGASGDWAIRAVVECGASPLTFADGFESGDTSAWSHTED